MMRIHRFARLCAVILAVLPVSGFTIVWHDDEQAAQVPQTDEERMAAYAADHWDGDVMPAIAAHLVPLAELRQALAQDAADAGVRHGMRPDGEANPFNFAVSGSGRIVEANTASRAAKLQVDTDADGKADVTVQLGPVVRGTALRDAMPFIVFTDFRDQIEFAKLANALNAQAAGRLAVPEGDLVGRPVAFEGVFTLRGDAATVELLPTKLDIGE